jgi:hypothetical protein
MSQYRHYIQNMYSIKILHPAPHWQALSKAPYSASFLIWEANTTPLYNYSCSPSTWDLQFSFASQLGASRIKVLYSHFRLEEVRSSFMKFLTSPARMDFQNFRSFLILPQRFVWGWCWLSLTWVLQNCCQIAIF